MSGPSSRLDRLESAFGIRGGVAPTAVERASSAVDSGTATLADFELAMSDAILVLRGVISVRSRYFRAMRGSGWEPWSWNPLDVAADIASLAVGQQPSQRLISLASEGVGQPCVLPRRASRVGRFINDRGRQFMLAHWRWRNGCFLALGASDGLPLRAAMASAAWEWDAEAEELLADSPWSRFLYPDPASCPRWQRLADHDVGVPMNLIE